MKTGKKLTKKDIKELQKQFPELPKTKYLCHCMECDKEWETDEKYSIQSYCPYCMCGDIDYNKEV